MFWKEHKISRTCSGGNKSQFHTSRRPGSESNITVGDDLAAYSVSSKGQFQYFEKLENLDITSLGRETDRSLEAHSKKFTTSTEEHRHGFCFVTFFISMFTTIKVIFVTSLAQPQQSLIITAKGL